MIKIRIKTKLSLGLLFLFLVIMLVGSIGTISIHRIANESKEVLKDNYESIEYLKYMLQASEKFDDVQAIQQFEKHLALQEKNITEWGEKELTENIRRELGSYKREADPATEEKIRQNIYQLIDINMQAIVFKSRQVQVSAHDVLSYIGLIGGFCFLIVFIFLVNFPGYIANPIREMTESIKQIADKNYTQRLNFKSNDEFGELAEAFNTMAQRLDHYENSNLATIMFEKQRIETIINNMKDAIIGFNEKKIILFANRQATSLLGMPEAEIIGKYAPDVAVQNNMMRQLISADTDPRPIKFFADNKESYFNKESVAVNSGSQAIGEVIILKNITQFQELDLAKTNLIATISHELKTPIASIKLSAKLLADSRVGLLNTEQKQLIDNIDYDSERLLRITAEVLNMAQVETGKLQLNQKPSDPRQIVDYAVAATRVQAQQKETTLEVLCGQQLPDINVDADKTAWVMINLVSNAIRYSPPKSKVIIRLEQQEKKIIFTVQDFGEGIAEDYREKIFDKYFQAPAGQKTGTGLGLAISKDFIEAQQGKIWVASHPGKGSTFGFSFDILNHKTHNGQSSPN